MAAATVGQRVVDSVVLMDWMWVVWMVVKLVVKMAVLSVEKMVGKMADIRVAVLVLRSVA